MFYIHPQGFSRCQVLCFVCPPLRHPPGFELFPSLLSWCDWQMALWFRSRQRTWMACGRHCGRWRTSPSPAGRLTPRSPRSTSTSSGWMTTRTSTRGNWVTSFQRIVRARPLSTLVKVLSEPGGVVGDVEHGMLNFWSVSSRSLQVSQCIFEGRSVGRVDETIVYLKLLWS